MACGSALPTHGYFRKRHAAPDSAGIRSGLHFPPPSPPGEKTTARQDQARKSGRAGTEAATNAMSAVVLLMPSMPLLAMVNRAVTE
jgi:hypothetical protein